MSELLAAIHEDEVHQHIAAAVAAGCQASPELATAAVVEKLEAAFSGQIIQKVIALIKSGMTNLPAILQALAAAGMVLPPWFSLVINILLAVVK